MSSTPINDAILEMYLNETSQLIEQLESIILDCEGLKRFPKDAVDEIFRIMHTIKGSSSMMYYSNIATLAHALEDLFSYIRGQSMELPNWSALMDLILESVDFIKLELQKVRNGDPQNGDASQLIETITIYLLSLNDKLLMPVAKKVEKRAPVKEEGNENMNLFKAIIIFEDGCEMENVRAYQIVHRLHDHAFELWHDPEDIEEDIHSVERIRAEGFHLYIRTERICAEITELLSQSSYLKQLEIIELENGTMPTEQKPGLDGDVVVRDELQHNNHQTSFISVNVAKLDELMNLVGELVIAEAMVTQNPALAGLQQVEQLQKAARHLQKITNEIQDKVMSIRMVPLTNTFQKMHRIVRDMCRKLGKDAQLNLIGEETEVDKNIIEHISDPIMHLVRNALDHGIEIPQERAEKGKTQTGKLTIEEVLIIVREDGRGLNKSLIIKRAKENNLLYKNEIEMSDREIFNLIFLPGFSTKESVTEFSGRGVGLDVVMKNIVALGGTVVVDSQIEQGTTITIKIPLTLAIIEGMNFRVGQARYTLPITAIKESMRSSIGDVITDPDGNEMIMVRGQCYPILRLHRQYEVQTDIVSIHEGILIMVEQDGNGLCLFVDELLGQQQVVVKALPPYIKSIKHIEGLSGCTLLGDGSISLILDVSGLIKVSR